jgi:hypothetical protein
VTIPIGPEGLLGRQDADIVVTGLDQAGPSFELRIFLNDPHADDRTEPTGERGYAGSIYVYGYGQPPERAGAGSDPRPHIPMTRRVKATAAVRAAAAKGAEMAVTLVPVAYQAPNPDIDLGEVQVSVLVHE